MNTSSSPIEIAEARAQQVSLTDDSLVVDLVDGRTIAVPLTWYPRLAHGSHAERSNWRPIGEGEGIHWPDLDKTSVSNAFSQADVPVKRRRPSAAGLRAAVRPKHGSSDSSIHGRVGEQGVAADEPTRAPAEGPARADGARLSAWS